MKSILRFISFLPVQSSIYFEAYGKWQLNSASHFHHSIQNSTQTYNYRAGDVTATWVSVIAAISGKHVQIDHSSGDVRYVKYTFLRSLSNTASLRSRFWTGESVNILDMHVSIFRRIRYNWCMTCRLWLWNIWQLCKSRSLFKRRNDHHILFHFCWPRLVIVGNSLISIYNFRLGMLPTQCPLVTQTVAALSHDVVPKNKSSTLLARSNTWFC